jgi:hypothetical protein
MLITPMSPCHVISSHRYNVLLFIMAQPYQLIQAVYSSLIDALSIAYSSLKDEISMNKNAVHSKMRYKT